MDGRFESFIIGRTIDVILFGVNVVANVDVLLLLLLAFSLNEGFSEWKIVGWLMVVVVDEYSGGGRKTTRIAFQRFTLMEHLPKKKTMASVNDFFSLSLLSGSCFSVGYYEWMNGDDESTL